MKTLPDPIIGGYEGPGALPRENRSSGGGGGDPVAGFVAHLKFEQNLVNEAGGADWTGTIAYTASGKDGYGIAPAGAQRIVGPSGMISSDKTVPWSFSGWIKSSAGGDYWQSIMNVAGAQATTIDVLTTGQTTLDVFIKGNGWLTSTPANLNDGNFHHVCFVDRGWNGSVQHGQLYWDGVKVADATTNQSLTSRSTQVTMCRGAYQVDRYWQNPMDEFYVWNNYILTQDDVTALYTQFD